MLYFPVKDIAAEEVHRAAKHFVDPFLAGIRSMHGIMHDTHADTCCTESHDDHEKQSYPCAHRDGKDQHKWNDIQGQHHDGLKDHGIVGSGGDPIYPEIIIDIFANSGGEVMLIFVACGEF